VIALHRFKPRLLDTLRGYKRADFFADLGAGLTVGVVALPLAMAFAIASGVKPEAGLVTAIVAGFLISAVGGSHVQIGGPAGAFIVIVYGIVERYGVANLLISTALAGVLLVVMGALRMGAWVRYVPVSIVIGFTNGIALLIGLSQVKDLLGLKVDKLPADFFNQMGQIGQHLDTVNPTSVVLGLGCLALVVVWPKSYALDPHRTGRIAALQRALAKLPGTLVALIVATACSVALGWPVETIGSKFGGIPSSLPAPAWPDFNWTTVKQLVAPTLTIAMLGAIESLLCARVADNLTDFPRHDPNQELMAQGVANVAAALFGGLPATGTVARTVTNVRTGARSPVAGMVHAVVLLAVVWVAAPWAAHVPMAALAGLLMFVAWNMGEWREFVRAWQFSLNYRVVLFGTFALTVIFDLTVAVEVGLVLACLFFIWHMGTLFEIRDLQGPASQALPAGVKAFELYGSLFFGAVGQMEDLPSRIDPQVRAVVLDMHRLVSMDTSGLEALQQLHRALERRKTALILADVNPQPLSLIRRSGFEATLGADQIVPQMFGLKIPDIEPSS
jgi:sulfate permease, SulP family